MKTNTIKYILIALGVALLLPAMTFPAMAQQKKQKRDAGPHTEVTREVEAFDAIKLSSVGNIRFTQSDTYSLRLEGSANYIEQSITEVKGGTLYISSKEDFKGNVNLTIYLSAPTLTSVNIEGVGDFVNEGSLRCDRLSLRLQGVGNIKVKDLKCDKAILRLEGVGNIKADMECDNLSAHVNGVGSMELSGRARVADLKKDGIGSIKRKNLIVGEE